MIFVPEHCRTNLSAKRLSSITTTTAAGIPITARKSALRGVQGEPAQPLDSAATLSVWAAAQQLVVTELVLDVCITTTKSAVS